MKGIYVWKTKPEDGPEFLRRWKEESEVLHSYPGAGGTEISESKTEPGLFLCYARWPSLEDREAAVRQRAIDGRDQITSDQISELVFGGLFEDAQVIVPPAQQ